jgi:hypothetical protein
MCVSMRALSHDAEMLQFKSCQYWGNVFASQHQIGPSACEPKIYQDIQVLLHMNCL